MSAKVTEVVDEKAVEFEKACQIAQTVVDALSTNPGVAVVDSMSNMTTRPADGNRIYVRWTNGTTSRFVIKTLDSLRRIDTSQYLTPAE